MALYRCRLEQDGENSQLLVKLNKDLNLSNNGSVTMGQYDHDNDQHDYQEFGR